MHDMQAGLLIAETEFALQVESDIAPYKGLLMGLFFMTVGMEISVGLFFARIKTVVAGILGLLIGKVGSRATSSTAFVNAAAACVSLVIQQLRGGHTAGLAYDLGSSCDTRSRLWNSPGS